MAVSKLPTCAVDKSTRTSISTSATRTTTRKSFMKIKSQTMIDVMQAMIDVENVWLTQKDRNIDDMINPNAPVVIQIGDYGYEIQSVGGDEEIEGFVIMCKENPVCKWEGMECIKL